jgi:hypothetical protein
MNKSIVDKASLKEQLQINMLQVFEDVNLMPDVDENVVGTIKYLDAMRHSDEFRDQILDHMCDVIIETVNKA